jgi:multiple sugar transport system substrate-binding protein
MNRTFRWVCIMVLLTMVMSLVAGPAGAADTKPFDGKTIRLLFVADPFAAAAQKIVAQLEEKSGAKIQLEVVPYDPVHQKILLNSQSKESAYDAVSVDIVWEGEFGSGNVLLPLDKYIADSKMDMTDFLPAALTEAQYQGKQLGLPLQPHPELMWYRKDIFDQKGLKPPETTDDVLALAKQLNDPANNFYGICFNGQRGQPLGQQMAHFYSAFGQKLFDDKWHPTLDTPDGLRAANYTMELMKYAPPDILNMAWDERARQFSQGGCAMIYEWGARSFLAEDPDKSKVSGKVGYIAAPHAPDKPAVTPNGEWSISIPSNVKDPDTAWKFVQWLTAPEQLKMLALAGNSGMPRYSIIRDPELIKKYPVFPAVDALATKGELNDYMRPAIPEWSYLADTLGTTFNQMMAGSLTPAQATKQAQDIMDKKMKEDGYYQ